ncbi:hypothetical protein DAEQUDRAFT_559452 [Daedalea quercina L-15889]|uniref:Uncharacterized protein n=1 Tax=Daedalea quercina L-15889 TaxID=1314783 RepID=A0A165M0B2_9APHY|nr:hypothetical protein DAEQUDRAFT_559452 [Daedalea quercina L-15889]
MFLAIPHRFEKRCKAPRHGIEDADALDEEDWAEGYDADHKPYAYVCECRETVFFLHQPARGKPLFPNVIWEHPVSDVLSALSPTVHVLRSPFDDQVRENNHRPGGLAYRMQRHLVKTLLPSVLQSLPDLQELCLRPLGHEGFWMLFAPGPDHCFIVQSIRILHISESLSVLLRGALPAISTIRGLKELAISVVSSHIDQSDIVPITRDKTRRHIRQAAMPADRSHYADHNTARRRSTCTVRGGRDGDAGAHQAGG